MKLLNILEFYISVANEIAKQVLNCWMIFFSIWYRVYRSIITLIQLVILSLITLIKNFSMINTKTNMLFSLQQASRTIHHKIVKMFLKMSTIEIVFFSLSSSCILFFITDFKNTQFSYIKHFPIKVISFKIKIKICQQTSIRNILKSYKKQIVLDFLNKSPAVRKSDEHSAPDWRVRVRAYYYLEPWLYKSSAFLI